MAISPVAVRRKYLGKLQRGNAQRDTDKYPAINQTLLNDIRSGLLDIILTDGTLIPANTTTGFDFTYNFTTSGSDFNGTPFVKTPAPRLTPVVQSRPRARGNNYDFPLQTALNTVLFGRIPAFQVADGMIVVYAGVQFNDVSLRPLVTSRGYNAVGDNMPDRTTISDRGVYLLASLFDQAQSLVDYYNQYDPGNPNKSWLADWAGPNHYLIDNQNAARELGALMQSTFSQGEWAAVNGKGPLALNPDFEVNNANPRSGNSRETQHQNMVGYVMEGAKIRAQQNGQPAPLLIPYDWSYLSPFHLIRFEGDQPASGPYYDNGGNALAMSDHEPGVPAYLNHNFLSPVFLGGSKNAPIAANTPMAQYIKNTPGSAAGSAEYFHYTYDDQSFFQKDADGNYLTEQFQGKTVLVYRTDSRTTTIMGQSAHILGSTQYGKGEAFDLVYECYERVAVAIADYKTRAGGVHLPTSAMRQSGWENLKLMQWWRYDREFKDLEKIPAGQSYDVTELNTEPLNPHALEGDVIAQYWLRDILRPWMGPQKSIDLGQNYDAAPGFPERSRAKGAYEVFSKALQRCSVFNWVKSVPHQWVIPRYLIKNQNLRPDVNERFEKKPLVFSLIVPNYNGKTYLLTYGRYVAQDVDRSTGMRIWLDKGTGPIGNSYAITLTGRDTFLDVWEVPSEWATAQPAHVKYQFTDMTGEKQTWSGDYRQPVIYSNHPTPPLLAL
ncbi:hypothetical protein [Spirosoma sp. KUDC1026]|uniref:hypothetical protein n=1 Tax=Spirosoma sp. KUDC1026 TaxID=2745947 RepID=UPI00159BB636|nr:hypothetical protein [Spirosoma sp. KUDC1026]QKZ15186.1 hypothetical protein HU175_22195 [Spirosoma sp. KUDC1026]